MNILLSVHQVQKLYLPSVAFCRYRYDSNSRTMALTAEQIVSHPALHACIREQSRALLSAYAANPRLSSVFATQQRWLMAHCALALYFRRVPGDDRTGLNAARFFEVMRRYDVASRNTADAFLKEMIQYRHAHYLPGGSDKRVRSLEPSKEALEALHGWAIAHLATLDALDAGGRLSAYLASDAALARMHPRIADALLTHDLVRQPPKTFSLFTWLNNGGIVMDWLIAGIEPAAPEVERIPTSVFSIADMAQRLNLSRTHLTRKLREAEAMGSVGWQGRRGKSVMWVSKEFRAEYAMEQAVKLSIIDAAFEVSIATPAAENLQIAPNKSQFSGARGELTAV